MRTTSSILSSRPLKFMISSVPGSFRPTNAGNIHVLNSSGQMPMQEPERLNLLVTEM